MATQFHHKAFAARSSPDGLRKPTQRTNNYTTIQPCEDAILRDIHHSPSNASTSEALGRTRLMAELPVFASLAEGIAGRTSLPDLYREGAFLCGMALLYSDLCAEDEESVLRCTRRVGVATLGRLLPSICQDTPYYAALARTLAAMEAQCGLPAPPASLPLGVVDETQLLALPEELTTLALAPGSTLLRRAYSSEGLTAEEEAAVRRAYYVPPARRIVADMPPPLKCSSYAVHPIDFAATQRPAHVRFRDRRLFPFFPIVPSAFGNCPLRVGEMKSEYVLTDKSLHEWLYATIMRYSMFGYSHKRGGWACLRNQEMMFYGVVPVFVDLLLAGPLFFSNTPRQLMHDVLLQEPMLQKIGYMKDMQTIAHGNQSTEKPSDGTYFRRCGNANVNFVRPGELDLEPYREEHREYYAKSGAAEAPPLTHLSPAVVPHFRHWAKQMWDSYPRHSAAAMVQYMLATVGCPDPRRVLVIGYSRFPTDYTHESIVTGFNDLGIFVDTFVRQEVDKFQRLSFYHHRQEREGTWTAAEREALEQLRADGYIGDPRTIGMREWEKQRGARLAGAGGSFTMMGRWNPLLVRRLDGSAARPISEQMSAAANADSRHAASARLQALMEEDVNRYDLVIYSVVNEEFYEDKNSFPLYQYATQHVPKEKLVFVDHMDFVNNTFHIQFGSSWGKHGWTFQRELVAQCVE